VDPGVQRHDPGRRRCLDVTGAHRTDRGGLYTCNGSGAQVWTPSPATRSSTAVGLCYKTRLLHDTGQKVQIGTCTAERTVWTPGGFVSGARRHLRWHSSGGAAPYRQRTMTRRSGSGVQRRLGQRHRNSFVRRRGPGSTTTPAAATTWAGPRRAMAQIHRQSRHAGTTTVSFRVAPSAVPTPAPGQLGGHNLSGNVNIAATGGWQNWSTSRHRHLPAGRRPELAQDKPGWNVNYLSLAAWLRVNTSAW